MPTLTEGMAEHAAAGCLIKPFFHRFFQDPSIEFEFQLKVARPVRRKPDGWFHASQHPLASDKQLYDWMTGQHQDELIGYPGLMSMMFGSLGHAVFESVLDLMGVAVPLPPGDCPACGRPRRRLRARPDPAKYCTEHGFADPQTLARCHLDSIADFGQHMGVDFKTCHQYALKGVKDMDEAAFRAKWPEYWAQMQECMRLSGLQSYIVFFLTLGFPWDTREFHFAADPEFQEATRRKYEAVLWHVENKVPILL